MHEDKTTEFKSEYTDSLKKTVIAFANSDGGTIYIGIRDDGEVVGLQDAAGVILQVANAVRDAIRPDVTLFTDYARKVIEDKEVVVVSVQRGAARPYYLQKKGLRPVGVYVRQGASTVPATEAAILSLIKETGGDSYETARSLEQQLTFEGAAAYFQKKNLSFGRQQKKTLGLINEDDMYTNLGLLLSEQCPHTIRLAVFEGGKKAVFKERREFGGSLLEQIEEAYGMIQRYNRTRGEFFGLERVDRTDYPEEALREALLNAVVHRDYGYSASTLIHLFDDRIEFVSVGGLTQGLALEDVMLGVSMLRNPKLGNVFYRLGLIEAYGTGISRIFDSYDEGMKPEIAVSTNAFKVVLPNRNESSNGMEVREEDGALVVSTREKQVLALFGDKYSLTRKEVEEALGISQSTAVVLLKKMLGRGLLEKVGAGKNTRYRMS